MTFQGKHKDKSVYRMVRNAYSLKIKTTFNLKTGNTAEENQIK